jgi:hypothetical protein
MVSSPKSFAKSIKALWMKYEELRQDLGASVRKYERIMC